MHEKCGRRPERRADLGFQVWPMKAEAEEPLLSRAETLFFVTFRAEVFHASGVGAATDGAAGEDGLGVCRRA